MDGNDMAENEQPSRSDIGDAIRTQRDLPGEPDRSNLRDTLVKSALWKENTLRRIEQSSVTGVNDDTLDPDDRRESTTLRRSSEEVARLRKIIAKLKAENSRLATTYREEVGNYQNQLLEFQAAYDQFQQQSDQLMAELDNDNERLRTECKLNNRRSLL